MKRRFRIIWIEICKLFKPIISIIILFAGGIIAFIHYIWPILPTFYSIIICSMLFVIIILSVLVWKISLLAISTTWYDREYSLMKINWNYFLSNDTKSLDAEYLGERKFTCRDGEIKHLTVEISKEEPLIPFNKNDNYNL